MYIVNVAVPVPSSKIYVPTRLVIGCEDQAKEAADLLERCGVHAEVSKVDVVPERSADEKRRAQELMVLLYVPAPNSLN